MNRRTRQNPSVTVKDIIPTLGASAAAARAAVGASAVGDAVFTAEDAAAAREVIGAAVNQPPRWGVKTRYAVGQLVSRGGRLLRCATAHTSSSTYGGFNAANWTDVGAAADKPSAIESLTLRGSDSGADTYDSTPHITIESWQRPQGGDFGESLRLANMQPQSKSMITWSHPTDPSQAWNETTNPLKHHVWVGAHYGAQDDADGVHGHWSVEVPAANGGLRSRFGIDWLDNRQGGGSAGTVGADITSSYFSSTDLTIKQGEGEVLRLSAGAGSADRTLEFSAHGNVAGQPPGYIDTTKRRWHILCNQDAESGSNAGANLVIRSFADDGTVLATAMFIKRSSGVTSLGSTADAGGQLNLIPNNTRHGLSVSPSATLDSGKSAAAFFLKTAGDRALDIRVQGDGNPRLKVDSNGKMDWGGNGSAVDTTFSRDSAGVLRTPGSLRADVSLLLNTTSVAGGVGVLAMGNAGTVPPNTPSGGGVLYVEAGALKFKGSGGTVTTVAVA